MKRALVIALLLVFPVGAEARPFNADEMRAVELAHDYWGKGPACPTITYEAVSRQTVGGSGEWSPDLCRLRIADDMLPLSACTTIAHEWGHAVGHIEHSPMLGAIMSQQPQATPQCLRADDRRTYRALRSRCVSLRGKLKRKCVRRARLALAH